MPLALQKGPLSGPLYARGGNSIHCAVSCFLEIAALMRIACAQNRHAVHRCSAADKIAGPTQDECALLAGIAFAGVAKYGVGHVSLM